MSTSDCSGVAYHGWYTPDMTDTKKTQPSRLSALLWNLVFIGVGMFFLALLGAKAWEAVVASLGLIILYDIKMHLLGILHFTYLNRVENSKKNFISLVRDGDEKSESD